MKYFTTLFMLLFCINLFPSQHRGETILVIESYHAENPWDASYKSGLKSILGGYDLMFFEMDTKRLPPSEYPNRAKMAYEFYEKTKQRGALFWSAKHKGKRRANRPSKFYPAKALGKSYRLPGRGGVFFSAVPN